MAVIFDNLYVASTQLSNTTPDGINFQRDQTLTGTPAFAPDRAIFGTPVGPNADLAAPDRPFFLARDFHFDWHFRFRFVPATLALTNPRIGSPIPFVLWNTFRRVQTLDSINTGSSSVLTFDFTVGYQINDSAIVTQNLFIAAGEPEIDTNVIFGFTDGDGTLRVIASLSTTFDLEYDSPVTERWEYLTEVLVSYNNSEQRVSLRPNPRRDLDFSIDPITLAERRRLGELLFASMAVPTLLPYYQYSVVPTAISLEGSQKIFCNPQLGSFRIGQFVSAVNPDTGESFIGEITSIDVDGLVFGAVLNTDVDEQFIVSPMVSSTIRDDSGFRNLSVSSGLSIRAQSLVETPLRRSDDVVEKVTFYDTYPVLDVRPLRGQDEGYTYRRETIDNEVGQRFIDSADPATIIEGKPTYFIRRRFDPDTMDFFRQFFDYVKGSHKAFLMPTWLPDLNVVGPVVSGTATFDILETGYESLYFPREQFKRLYIQFSDGTPPQTVTVQTATIPEGETNVQLILTDNLPDPNPGGNLAVETISFLTLVRAGDVVNLDHDQTDTRLSFGIRQVEG